MKLALLVLAAAAIAAPAFAQAPAASPAMQEARQKMAAACAADMQTLCGSATDGPSRMQCMRENQSKLSDGCKEAMAAMMAARQAAGGSH
jgi:hypothetical protein